MTDEIPINTGEDQGVRDPITGRILPGRSLNPAGKPKGARHLTTLVREALQKMAKTEDGKEIKLEEALVKKIIHLALTKEDPTMIRLMWNYLDGMPTQNIAFDDVGEDDRSAMRELVDILKNGKNTDQQKDSEGILQK